MVAPESFVDQGEYKARFRNEKGWPLPSEAMVDHLDFDRFSRQMKPFMEVGIFVAKSNAHLTQITSGYRFEGDVAEDQVVVVPALRPTQWAVRWPVEAGALLIQPSFIEEIGGELGLNQDRIELLNEDPSYDETIVSMMEFLLEELRRYSRRGWPACRPAFAESVVQWLVAYLLRRHSNADQRKALAVQFSKTDRKLSNLCKNNVLDYMHANLNLNLGLKDFAKIAGVENRFRFNRQFSAACQMGPVTYFRHLKIEKAKGLLREGMRPVDVATAVGFLQATHFGKIFLKKVGQTPGEFRKEHLASKIIP
jgi:AraC-like DNA-binding protein